MSRRKATQGNVHRGWELSCLGKKHNKILHVFSMLYVHVVECRVCASSTLCAAVCATVKPYLARCANTCSVLLACFDHFSSQTRDASGLHCCLAWEWDYSCPTMSLQHTMYMCMSKMSIVYPVFSCCYFWPVISSILC